MTAQPEYDHSQPAPADLESTDVPKALTGYYFAQGGDRAYNYSVGATPGNGAMLYQDNLGAWLEIADMGNDAKQLTIHRYYPNGSGKNDPMGWDKFSVITTDPAIQQELETFARRVARFAENDARIDETENSVITLQMMHWVNRFNEAQNTPQTHLHRIA